jgi:FKBP-type peptidyl-prolyl cis-trans isomerase
MPDVGTLRSAALAGILALQAPQLLAQEAWSWTAQANYAVGYQVADDLRQRSANLKPESLREGAYDAVNGRPSQVDPVSVRQWLVALKQNNETKMTSVPVTSLPLNGGSMDQVSYAVGYMLGEDLVDQGIALEQPMLMLGAKDGINNLTPRIGSAELQALLRELKNKVTDLANVRLSDTRNDPAKGFFEENAKRKDVVTASGGLQYRVLQTGSGRAPSGDDTVVISYVGNFLSGAQFTSSPDRDGKSEASSYKLSSLYPGLREAIALMNEGAIFEVFIPARLGPAPRRGNPLEGKAMVYELKLLEVRPAQSDAVNSITASGTSPTSPP